MSRSARGSVATVSFGLLSAAVSLLLVTACSTGSASAAPPVSPVLTHVDPLAHNTFDTHPGPVGAVLTQRGDDTRLGWYSHETALTTASVGSGRFGKLAAYPVDGKIYAQPLYVPGLSINGAIHNVVFVATEHDSVYAFDADATGSTPPPPLWHASLLAPGARTLLAASDRVGTNRLCDSITPEVGITSTPVIDLPAKAMYVVALDVEQGRPTYRVHRLNLSTGTDTRPSTVVSASVPGTGVGSVNGQVPFVAGDEQQRVGLTLDDGTLYLGFASWCGLNPYHGWILGYRTSDLSRSIVFNSSPNGLEGGLWESQNGFTVDGRGHLLVVTGNGEFNLNTGGTEAGDSVLELVPSGGTLRAIDTFTPFDQQCRFRHDQDLGSGSPLLIPGHDELLLSSKTGAVYLLDGNHLGGYTPLANACKQRGKTTVDRIKQELTIDSVPGGMWGTWGYWHSTSGEYVYGSGAAGKVTQWRLAPNGTLVTTPVARAPEPFSYPGAIPVVSSNGSIAGSGVVWTVDDTHGAALRAYDASNIGHELWNSTADPARDGLDDTEGFNHFDVPTVADGHVLVGDQGHLEIYGLL